LAVEDFPARFDSRDIKEMIVSATFKTDLQRFACRGMRTVAPGKIGGGTFVHHSIRPLQACNDAIWRGLKIRQLRLALHINADFGQTSEKQKFVPVVEENERVRIRAEATTQITEDGPRRSLTCDPKISGNRLSSELHYCMSKPDLAVKF